MPGAERLRDSSTLQAMLAQQQVCAHHMVVADHRNCSIQASGKKYAAICASPAVVFESQGLLDGKKATCHPAFVDKLTDPRYVFQMGHRDHSRTIQRNHSNAEQRVVVDGALTTSRGPGTTFEFALSLVQQLFGEDKAAEVAKPMVMYKH